MLLKIKRKSYAKIEFIEEHVKNAYLVVWPLLGYSAKTFLLAPPMIFMCSFRDYKTFKSSHLLFKTFKLILENTQEYKVLSRY
jgi:hypothetical protein